MENYFTFILMIIYFTWLIITFLKIKTMNNQYENIDKDLEILVDKVYTNTVAFNKCKNFTTALQLNLKYQINSLKKLPANKKFSVTEYLDCIKDIVDTNDMTFYVGNNTINMLLRKKVRECIYRDIMLDVVADLSDINIDETHLFLIFSNLVDLSIEYLKQGEENKKYKILIREAKKKLKNNDFLIIQIAYNIIENIKDIDINEYHKDMVDLISTYYNGTIISEEKNGRIVKTVMIPLLIHNNI